MVPFERDLWDLFSKIKFRKVSRNIQNQLKENIKAMKKSRNLFAFADKTSNIYQIKKGEYNKLTTDAITKRFLAKLTTKLIRIGKKKKENKDVVNQIFVNDTNSCFITLKDHLTNKLKQS